MSQGNFLQKLKIILNNQKIMRYKRIPSNYTKNLKDKRCTVCWDPNMYEVNSCPFCNSNEKFVKIKKPTKKCVEKSPSTTKANRSKSRKIRKRKTKNIPFKLKREKESKNEKISSQNDSPSTTWTLCIGVISNFQNQSDDNLKNKDFKEMKTDDVNEKKDNEDNFVKKDEDFKDLKSDNDNENKDIEDNFVKKNEDFKESNMTTFEWTMTPNAPQPNDPQAESEIEVIVSPNIERPPPEKVNNSQQLPSREEIKEDEIICLESREFKDLFFFHKLMQCKQGIKRKFNPNEDENEENVDLPKKKMRITMKKMWNFLKRSKETKSNFQEKRPKKINLEEFFNLNNKSKKTVQTAVK